MVINPMINAHSSRNACDLVFSESLYRVSAVVVACNVMMYFGYGDDWQLIKRNSDGGDENSYGGDENNDGGYENSDGGDENSYGGDENNDGGGENRDGGD